MELLTLQSFLQHLKPYNDRELLTPQEASRITLTITELLVDRCVEPQLLKFLSRFLTKQSYDDIVEERNIEHECGYVICNKSPCQRVRRLSANSNGTISASMNDPSASMKYQIYNRKPTMILPSTYLSQYCCKKHYQASLFYRNQLSNEALFARKDIVVAPPFPINYPSNWYENGITCLEEVLSKHEELKHQGKTLVDVITMMNGLSVSDEKNDETNELIKLVEDFQIIENEGGLTNDVSHNDNDDNDQDYAIASLGKEDSYVTNDKSFGGYVV